MTRKQIFDKLQQIQSKSIVSLCMKLRKDSKHQNLVDEIKKTTTYLPEDCKMSERLYHIANNLFERPLCLNCQEKHVKFRDFVRGYLNFCSSKCSNSYNGTIEKKKRTVRKNFGVEHQMHSDLIKNKIKQTNLERYGVENPLQSQEIRKKIKQTNLERYNGITPACSEIVLEKMKETNLKRYGGVAPSCSVEIQNKMKQTNLERYNVENPMQNLAVQSKVKQTNLERYGVENVFQNDNIKVKIKQSILEKYNVENPSQSEIIKEKKKQTSLEHYGVESPMQSEEVKRKISQRRLRETYKFISSSRRIGNEYELLTPVEEYNGVQKQKLLFKHKKCGYIFEYFIRNGKYPLCPKCYFNTSRVEAEVRDFVELYFSNPIYNPREIIPPKEIDIFIPEINLAIEVDGIYYHTETFGKDSDYHLQKSLACWDQGIDLVHIFEDEWLFKKDIVMSMLLNRFGQTSRRIFARKCTIGEVDASFARDFLEENHIQGFINGRHFGLAYGDELVSLITVGKPRFNKKYDIEIYRFCSVLDTTVVGGLSRLIKYVQKKLNPKSILTYVDLRYGIGKGYSKVGFNYVGISKPGYFYVKDNQRYHRQQFQKHKLSTILETFDPNLTEEENMFENGYYRIWDCGNAIFELV